MRIGLVLAGGVEPTSAVQLGVQAEAAGLSSFWMTEGISGDAFAVLAAAATRTKRVALGTAIVSVFTRSLPLIGMATATLSRLSAGRFVLGLGASHREQVEGEHGLIFTSARDRLEDAVEVVRRILSDGTITDLHLRTTEIARFNLGFSPLPVPVPIYLAAIGPKRVEFAWTKADGALVIWRTPAEVAALPVKHRREQVLACILHCVVGESTLECEEALTATRAQYAKRFDRYRRLFDAQPHQAGVICDGMDSIAARIAEYERAGVDELLLLPIAAGQLSIEDAATRLMAFANAAAPSRVVEQKEGGLQ